MIYSGAKWKERFVKIVYPGFMIFQKIGRPSMKGGHTHNHEVNGGKIFKTKVLWVKDEPPKERRDFGCKI